MRRQTAQNQVCWRGSKWDQLFVGYHTICVEFAQWCAPTPLHHLLAHVTLEKRTHVFLDQMRSNMTQATAEIQTHLVEANQIVNTVCHSGADLILHIWINVAIWLKSGPVSLKTFLLPVENLNRLRRVLQDKKIYKLKNGSIKIWKSFYIIL